MSVYILHCHVHDLCYNDGENLGGPVTKTVNLLYGKENKQGDKRLVHALAAE